MGSSSSSRSAGWSIKLRDEDAGAFASGEARDGLVKLLAGEEESRGPGGDVNDAVLIDDGIAVGRERAAQGLIFVELAVLLEVDDAQVGGALDGARGWLKLAGEQAHERGFAAAVGADEADAHSGGERKVEVLEERPVFDGVS